MESVDWIVAALVLAFTLGIGQVLWTVAASVLAFTLLICLVLSWKRTQRSVDNIDHSEKVSSCSQSSSQDDSLSGPSATLDHPGKESPICLPRVQEESLNLSDSYSLKLSEKDIRDIACNSELLRDELHFLFMQLGIKLSDIDAAERSADTRNYQIQSIEVLRLWRQKRGSSATRLAILDALEQCRFKETKEIFEEKWSLAKDHSRKVSSCSPSSSQDDSPCGSSATAVHSVFDLEACRNELITFYKYAMSKVQLLPWWENESKDISDIYVTLRLEQGSNQCRSILLSNNEDVVSLCKSEGLPAWRILLKGVVAGSGKSTLLAKLAYSWAQQLHDSPLAKFQLLFIISLREVERCGSLIDEIFNQIFEKNTAVSKECLQTYIDSNPHKIFLLLDGFDEYSRTDLSKPNGSLEEIIAFERLRECRTILTTRPHKDLVKHQSSYLSIDVLGFSKKNVVLYMTKFFKNTRKVQGLRDRIQESETLPILSTIPIILMLMCLLWNDEQKLPDSQSELYREFVLFLWRKYCTRKNKIVDLNSSKLNGDLGQFISMLGKIAFSGLCSEETMKAEKIVFNEIDFEELVFKLGCETGVLTRERLRSKLNVTSTVTFLHKSFQEFCAAKYLANLYTNDPEEFQQILTRFSTWENLWNKSDMFKFLCGLTELGGLISFMKHAIRLYSPVYSRPDKIYIGHKTSRKPNIMPLFILLNESRYINFQNEKDLSATRLSSDKPDSYTNDSGDREKIKIISGLKLQLNQVFRPFFPDDGLVIDVNNENPAELRIFHNFVKSNIGFSMLSTVRSVQIINPHLGRHVIADTLKCVRKADNLQIDCRVVTTLVTLAKLTKINASTSLVFHRQVKHNVGEYLQLLLGALDCNNLTLLDFSKSGIKQDGIEILLKNLQKLPNLKALDLSHNTVGHIITSLITETLKCCSKLERLNSSHIRIIETGVEIEHLSLQHIDSDHHNSPVSNDQTSIRPYNLRYAGCKMSDEETRLLLTAFLNPHIKVIDFDNAELSEGQIKMLSEFLPNASNMHEMIISHNIIGMAIKPLIAQTLKYCSKLTKLDLSHIRMTEKGGKIEQLSLQHIDRDHSSSPVANDQTALRQYRFIFDGHKMSNEETYLLLTVINNPQVKVVHSVNYKLNLSHAEITQNCIGILTDNINKFPNLHVLDLSNNTAGAAITSLMTQILKCSKVKKLDLSHTRMKETGGEIEHLSLQNIGHGRDHSSSRFEYQLRFAGCKMSSEDTRLLLTAIMNTDVKVINFNNAKLSEEQIKMLSEFLPKTNNVQELNLSHNTVSMAIKPLIANTLKRCSKLTKLDLSHIRMTETGGEIQQLSLHYIDRDPSSSTASNDQTSLRQYRLIFASQKMCKEETNLLLNVINNPQVEVVDSRELNLSHCGISPDDIGVLTDNLHKLSNLKVLDLSYNTIGMAITSLISQTLECCSKLSKVDLSHIRMKEKGGEIEHLSLQYIAGEHYGNPLSNASGHTSLYRQYKLRFASCKMSLKDTRLLLTAFMNPRIKVIDFNNVSQYQIKILSDLLPKSTNLQELNLSHNIVGMGVEPVVAQTLKCCSNLTKVELSHISMTDTGGKMRQLSLQHIDRSQSSKRVSSNETSLRQYRLIFASQKMSNEETYFLLTVINNPQVNVIDNKELNLSHSAISPDDIDILTDSIHKWSNLEVLDLSYNILGMTIASLISQAIKHCSRLTKVELSHIQMKGTDGEIEHLSLQHIDRDHSSSLISNDQSSFRQYLLRFAGCKMSSKETGLLLRAFINPHIRVINCSNASLRDDQVEMLINLLPKAYNLQELNLAHNTVRRRAFELLLQHCAKLLKLTISGCHLTEDHIRSIIRFLPRASNLQVLDLSNNTVGVTIASLINQALKCCLKLTNLELSHIRMAETSGDIEHLHVSLQYIASDHYNFNVSNDVTSLRQYRFIFAGCKMSQEARMVLASINNPHIRVIDCKNAKLSEYQTRMLSESLSSASNLQELNLSHNQVDKGIKSILQSCTKLLKLNLSHCWLTENSINFLIKFLPKVSNLQDLDISHNKVGRMVPMLVQQLQNIRRLNLSCSDLTEIHIESMCKFLPVTLNDLDMSGNSLGTLSNAYLLYNPIRRYLPVSANHYLDLYWYWDSEGSAIKALAQRLKLCKLKRLNLSHGHLSEIHIVQLCYFLPDTIKDLDLSGNNIKNEIGSLSKLLTFCQLSRLNLSNAHLSESNIIELCESLPVTLNDLDLSENSIGFAIEYFTQQLKLCQLNKLNLSNANLKPDHIKTLAKCLPQASNLHVLIVSGNIIGKSVENLARQLQYCDIKTLDISRASIEEDHFEAMSRVLPMESNLQELDLSDNRIGKAIVSLAQKIKYYTDLTSLNLALTDIDDQGIVQLPRGFVSMPILAYFNLGGNWIRDQGIISLSHRFVLMPNLTYLNLVGYFFPIENQGVDVLFRNIHYLTKLEYLKIYVYLDEKCSNIVKACFATIRKYIKNGRRQTIELNEEECRLIQDVSRRYL